MAKEGRGLSDVNVCPWSKLEGACRWLWRAGRHVKPNHLNPRYLLDLLARGDLSRCDHQSLPSKLGLDHRLKVQGIQCVAGIY